MGGIATMHCNLGWFIDLILNMLNVLYENHPAE